jgi:hypothetical protein
LIAAISANLMAAFFFYLISAEGTEVKPETVPQTPCHPTHARVSKDTQSSLAAVLTSFVSIG